MQNLYTDLDIKLILDSHPYTSNICQINKKYRQLCKDPKVLKALEEKWLFPDQVDKVYLNLSLQEISEYALFYYPILESIGKYHPVSLYYRASVVYDEENCRYFLNEAINYIFQISDSTYVVNYNGFIICCLIAFRFGHYQLLTELYDKFILRLPRADKADIPRKEICMMCALCLKDKDRFDRAFEYYKSLGKNSESIISRITSIIYGYIPGLNLEEIIVLFLNLFEWSEAEPIYKTNFLHGLSTRNTDDDETELGIVNLASDLSNCLPDAVVGKYVDQLSSVRKNHELYSEIVADYWGRNNVEYLELTHIFSYRPDLLNEEELLTINKIDYIKSENFYYYLLHKGKIDPYMGYLSHYIDNHLGFSGYNIEVSELAIEADTDPSIYPNIEPLE